MQSKLRWLGIALSSVTCSRPDAEEPPALTQTAPATFADTSLGSASDGERARPLLFSKERRTWIYAEPKASSDKLGYLRAGASSPTSRQAAGNEGCSGGWYPIEPRGFVCVGATATFDPADPVVRATRDARPSFERNLPYIYGTVRRPGPVYDRLPTPEQLAEAEPDLPERMSAWLALPGESGASFAQHVWLGAPGSAPDPSIVWRERQTQDVPEFLAAAGTTPNFELAAPRTSWIVDRMRPRAGYSFLRTFLWEGRRYGLTSDLTLAATDRFRPIQGSDFRGVELGSDINLPFAFVRHPRARWFMYQASTDSLVDAGAASYRAAVPLTGKQSFFRGRLHFETRDGKWLSDLHASRLDPARRMPAWGTAGERWLDISLNRQTLVAYEGTRPVFATLISSGEAGLEDPEHTTATKRGIFRIHTKHVSSTMSSDEAGEEFELRDVPYVQYFDQGYAIHGAYWHDRFGTPKSHGCINVSPFDARRLFFFTEPQLPDNWHGVLLPLRGTVVFVHP